MSPPRLSFGVMGSRAYLNMATALVVLVALEAPTVHIIVGVVLDPGWARTTWQVVLGLSSLSLLIWLRRDYAALKRCRGVSIEGQYLRIDMGNRAQGQLRLDELEHASLTKAEHDEGGRGIVATPLQSPNLFLRFTVPQRLAGTMNSRMESHYVGLFVDEPEALLRALGKA